VERGDQKGGAEAHLSVTTEAAVRTARGSVVRRPLSGHGTSGGAYGSTGVSAKSICSYVRVLNTHRDVMVKS
jgi:hypothetical protein